MTDAPTTTYVALLRAVNVGGTGKLPMDELRELCAREGFGDVRTYIASGNVVFTAAAPADTVRSALEARLRTYAGKTVDVFVRTAREMALVRDENPFPEAAPNRVLVTFLHEPPAADTLTTLRGADGEEVRLGRREIYVHYDNGVARSKLVIPAAHVGTARNVNTVTRLAAMAAA